MVVEEERKNERKKEFKRKRGEKDPNLASRAKKEDKKESRTICREEDHWKTQTCEMPPTPAKKKRYLMKKKKNQYQRKEAKAKKV